MKKKSTQFLSSIVFLLAADVINISEAANSIEKTSSGVSVNVTNPATGKNTQANATYTEGSGINSSKTVTTKSGATYSTSKQTTGNVNTNSDGSKNFSTTSETNGTATSGSGKSKTFSGNTQTTGDVTYAPDGTKTVSTNSSTTTASGGIGNSSATINQEPVPDDTPKNIHNIESAQKSTTIQTSKNGEYSDNKSLSTNNVGYRTATNTAAGQLSSGATINSSTSVTKTPPNPDSPRGTVSNIEHHSSITTKDGVNISH